MASEDQLEVYSNLDNDETYLHSTRQIAAPPAQSASKICPRNS